MRFKFDENMPLASEHILSSAGHDVSSVVLQRLQGSPDERVIGVCDVEARALVTLDLDFADIRNYPPSEHHGIIVIRLRRQDAIAVSAALETVLPRLLREPLKAQLWIVEEDQIRIRE